MQKFQICTFIQAHLLHLIVQLYDLNACSHSSFHMITQIIKNDFFFLLSELHNGASLGAHLIFKKKNANESNYSVEKRINYIQCYLRKLSENEDKFNAINMQILPAQNKYCQVTWIFRNHHNYMTDTFFFAISVLSFKLNQNSLLFSFSLNWLYACCFHISICPLQ